MHDEVILEANDAFYAAFRQRDYLAMEALWSRQASVACYHPGWPGITGRDEVLDSWYSILVLGGARYQGERRQYYPQWQYRAGVLHRAHGPGVADCVQYVCR